MLSHEQIWKAIDRLADAHGYSTSGLAKRAGLDPTTFNRSKRFSGDGKERWPSTESIAKILSVTQATPAAFIALVDDQPSAAPGPRYIPLLPFAQAAKAGNFDKNGHPQGKNWDDIQFPATTSGPVYALEMTGEDGAPCYRPGDRIVIAPAEPVRRGDRVVVRTAKGELQIGELKRQTASRIDLAAFSAPDQETQLTADEVSWVARIIWASQ